MPWREVVIETEERSSSVESMESFGSVYSSVCGNPDTVPVARTSSIGNCSVESVGLFNRKRDFSPPGAITPFSFHPGTANFPRPSVVITVLEIEDPCGRGAIVAGVLVVEVPFD